MIELFQTEWCPASRRVRLDERYPEPEGADAHRAKAAKVRRRYLEEECECLQPATR